MSGEVPGAIDDRCAVVPCETPRVDEQLPLCEPCWSSVDSAKQKMWRVTALRRARAPRDPLAIAKHVSVETSVIADATHVYLAKGDRG